MTEQQPPVIIPLDGLEHDTLARILEEFISREGTDYGEEVFTLEQKRERLLKSLQQGRSVLLFDPESETTDIVSREVAARLMRKASA
jgi:uncharacterized protein YheU (UPF0270 family)